MVPRGHFVHFLVKLQLDNKTGWYAPVEVTDEGQQDGSFVVPVDASKRLYSSYHIEVAVYSKATAFGIQKHNVQMQKNGSLLVVIGTRAIRFRQRRTFGQWRALPYLGELAHGDFSHLLVEIEPADDSALESLYRESRIALVGCYPFAHYGGVNKLNHFKNEGRTKYGRGGRVIAPK